MEGWEHLISNELRKSCHFKQKFNLGQMAGNLHKPCIGTTQIQSDVGSGGLYLCLHQGWAAESCACATTTSPHLCSLTSVWAQLLACARATTSFVYLPPHGCSTRTAGSHAASAQQTTGWKLCLCHSCRKKRMGSSGSLGGSPSYLPGLAVNKEHGALVPEGSNIPVETHRGKSLRQQSSGF